MFVNVGRELKKMAESCVWWMTILAAIAGVTLGALIAFVDEGGPIVAIILGLLFGVIGYRIARMVAIKWYAYGEIVENLEKINSKLAENTEKDLL